MRIATSVREKGQLDESTIQKALATLATMLKISQRYDAPIKAVATHSVRTASNSEEFLKRVEQEVGITIDIIDGPEEARLSFLGIGQGTPLPNEAILAIDIGGGSTEIIVSEGDKLHFTTSIPIGAVTAHERFLESKGPNAKGLQRLKTYLISRLFPVGIEISKYKCQLGIATSGTAKACAIIHNKTSEKTELTDVDGYQLNLEAISHVQDSLKKTWAPAKISKVYGISQRRSEIVLAGATIFESIARLLSVKTWKISSHGLREGIATDWFARRELSSITISKNIRWDSILRFAKRYKIDQRIALATSTISVDVFKKITKLLSQNPDDDLQFADLVRAAGFLRDCGKFINFPSFHKHSYYLISNSYLFGYSQKERHLIALTARYSRKNPAGKKSAAKKPYGENYFDLIQYMSTAVRIAAIFSRSRPKTLPSLRIELADGTLMLTVSSPESKGFQIEKQVFHRELANIEKALGIPLDYQIATP